MRGATLFFGIGAPECAAPHFDWQWSAEIDPFAAAVHAARFPGVPNLGDVNRIDPDAVEPVDLVVFGSPCQSFSVAGRRLGLDDPRGNLALVALRLIGRIRPKWMVFENVPGLLSSNGGRDFGAFLGLMGECGYGFAYRILDAQYAGVPQRRRRVFIVGCLGDWRGPAAVLFESESLRGETPPRREAGERIARPVAGCLEGGSGYRNDADTADNLIAFSAKDHGGDAGETAPPTLRAGQHHKSHAGGGVMPAIAYGLDCENLGDGGNVGWHPAEQPSITLNTNGNIGIAHSVYADGFDVTEDGTGRGTPLTVAFQERTRADGRNIETQEDVAYALTAPNGGGRRQEMNVAAFHENQRAEMTLNDTASSLTVGGGKPGQRYPAAMTGMLVRRLTPRECERLQGFPDDFTAIAYRGKPAADGPRYRALGNSMAVPVIGWVLGRIHQFEGGV